MTPEEEKDIADRLHVLDNQIKQIERSLEMSRYAGLWWYAMQQELILMIVKGGRWLVRTF